MSIHNLINQMEYDRRQAQHYIHDCLSIVIERVREDTVSSMDFFVLGECNAHAKTYGWLKTRSSIEWLATIMCDEGVEQESVISALNRALKNLSNESK